MLISKTEYLNLFFTFLNDNNIPYCVVGDTSNLPYIVPSDVDLVISRTDFINIKKIIVAFSVSHNSKLVQSFKHEQTAQCFVLSFSTSDNKTDYIALDICSDFYQNGKFFILADEILSGRKLATTEDGENKLFYACAPEVEFCYYAIKKINKGALNAQQFKHLVQQYVQAPKKCQLRLHKWWQKNDVENIITAMNNRDFNQLNSLFLHLKKKLAANAKKSFIVHWREFKRKVTRVLNPTGMVLVFLGPDGVGKTAIGERLEQELAPAFRGLKRFHLRPSILGKKNGKVTVVTNPHEKPPRNIVSSVAKLIYFISDNILGLIFKVLPLKIKSHLIIFDRYYHDLLIDPKRYRYGAPKWLAIMVSWFIPKPDLFIILDAPAEVIQVRKQEVPLVETQRQRAAYLKFAKRQANCIVLDTSTGIDKTVKQGCDQILAFMNERELK